MEIYTLEIFFILFSVMGIMVLTWFILCKKLFKLLEENEPNKFKELGEISLFLNRQIILSRNIFYYQESMYLGNEYLRMIDKHQGQGLFNLCGLCPLQFNCI